MIRLSSPAKWILTGEHAVLRGHSAIVFPLHDFSCTLEYHANSMPLTVEGQPNGLNSFVLGLIHQVTQDFDMVLKGHITLSNTIPIGQGLGFSASVSLNIAKLLHALDCIPASRITTLAKQCEDIVHNGSSGLDICGVSASTPMLFKNGSSTSIEHYQLPNLYLHPTEQIGFTSNCIQNVAKLMLNEPKRADQIDKNMNQATDLIVHHLDNPDAPQWIEAIQLANQCFVDWGLITPCLQQAMDAWYAQGCLALKPTGSGQGGYLLGLWPPNTTP